MTDAANPTQEAQAAGAGNAQQFAIQRIFLKDASFETPMGADAFLKDWNPKINLDLNAKNRKLADGLYEVVLSITVNATSSEEEKTVFLVEVQQAGIFSINGLEPQNVHHLLGSACPNILFPYAREAIDSVVSRGSFPPLMLAPVNFEALYQSAMRQAVANMEQQENGQAEAPSSVQ